MLLRSRVASLCGIAAGLTEEDAEMPHRCELLCRDINRDALEVIRQNDAFSRSDCRCPFCTTYLAARRIVGLAVIAIDVDRQPCRMNDHREKQNTAKNEHLDPNVLHEILPSNID